MFVVIVAVVSFVGLVLLPAGKRPARRCPDNGRDASSFARVLR